MQAQVEAPATGEMPSSTSAADRALGKLAEIRDTLLEKRVPQKIAGGAMIVGGLGLAALGVMYVEPMTMSAGGAVIAGGYHIANK